jgi:hypothetical protein
MPPTCPTQTSLSAQVASRAYSASFSGSSAYAEVAFVDPYWPAFRRVDLLRALRDYTRQQRRSGA